MTYPEDVSPFDAAMQKADAAMLKRKLPKKVNKVNGHKTIDGVAMASVDYVENEVIALRKDFNDVLDGFEAPTAASKPMRVEVVSGDDVIGSVDGLTHFQLPPLLKVCSIKDARGMRMNVMLKGEMGGGKSTACKQVADALGLSFAYLGQTIMPHDVLGYVSQVDGQDYSTPFTNTFKDGGVIVLEEMDGWSPNATLCTNAALANGYLVLPNGVMVERHPDCVIIACTNTWGTGPTATYVGRNKLDDAFLDRFGVKIDWRYDSDLERLAAGNDDVVEVVQTARLNAKRAGIKVAISPRASIDIAKLVAAGFSMRDAINMNFCAGLDVDQRKMVLEGCVV